MILAVPVYKLGFILILPLKCSGLWGKNKGNHDEKMISNNKIPFS